MSAKQSLICFPRMLDVELTNKCNMACRMCPTGQRKLTRPVGFMGKLLFANIIGQAAEYKTPLRFIRWGEPTMHPDLIEYIKMANQAGLKTHLNTNGLNVDLKLILELFDSGLDSIKFSLQGIDSAGYEAMRGMDVFYSILERVRLMFRLRTERKLTRPFIQIATTVTTESSESIMKFAEMVGEFTDAFYVGRTRDLDKTNLPQAACECPEVFDKLSIDWDGRVSACCGDYDRKMTVGDMYLTPLKTIWMGPLLETYREKLRAYRHNELALCKSCARSKIL